MKSVVGIAAAACVCLLIGCSANPLMSGAEKVRIVTSDPQGCEYLGEATGNQGNFFTGGWTSNANLETGARNELKNAALKMGGNTVLILTSRAGVTGNYSVSNGYGGGSSQETNVTYSGTVYRCK
ncbi:MAG: hypothetical protein RLZ25_1230 [Pseudomonadota bacterium]|jgi:hypothetical protein